MTKKQIRSVISILFCVALIVTFFPILCLNYRHIERITQLEKLGTVSPGVVTGHRRALYPYKSCQFEALVQYQAADRTYLTTVGGCRINVTEIPKGAVVNVRYLPMSPNVSAIELDKRSFGGTGALWGILIFLSSMLVLSIVLVLRNAWRELPRNQNKGFQNETLQQSQKSSA